MSYNTFAKIVGPEKIKQFEFLNHQVPEIANEDFISLYKIWKHFKGDGSDSKAENPSNNIPRSSQKSPPKKTETNTNDVMQNIPNIIQSPQKKLNIIQNIIVTPRSLPRNTTNKIVTDVIVHKPRSPPKKPEINPNLENKNIRSIIQNTTLNVQNDIIPIPSTSRDANIISSDDVIYKLRSSPQKFEINTQGTRNTPDMSCDTQPEKTLNTNEQQTSSQRKINSSLFGQYLTVPESPKRKGKRNIERYPFAITSRRYQEMFEKKKELKEREENEKKERKRKREEKLLSKPVGKSQNKKKRQSLISNNENKGIVYCFVCKNTILEDSKIQCEECKKYSHKLCVPKKHQQFICDGEDNDDEVYLCHLCYKEDNTDSDKESLPDLESDRSDEDIDDLYNMYTNFMKKN